MEASTSPITPCFHSVNMSLELKRFYKSSASHCSEDLPRNEMLKVKGETVKVGKQLISVLNFLLWTFWTFWTLERFGLFYQRPRDFPTYGWDNEYGERAVEVKLRVKVSKSMWTLWTVCYTVERERMEPNKAHNYSWLGL